MNFIQKYKKIIIIVSILLIGITLVIVLIKRQKADLDIIVSPANATIKVGGSTLKNLQKHQISAGKYEVEISKDGYKTEKFSIEIKPRTKNNIYKSLKKTTTDNDSSKKEPDLLDSAVGSNIAISDQINTVNKNPILKKLPYIDTDARKRFKILPVMENDELKSIRIALNIGSCTESIINLYKKLALQKLREIEKDAESKYQIIITSNCQAN